MFYPDIKYLSVLLFYIKVNIVLSFKPEIQMPFKKISGSPTIQINKIGSTLTCNEQRHSLKDCATECYNRSLKNTGCPGFYKKLNQNNICNICHVSSYSEIQANSSTTFGTNDELYLMQSVRPNTDIEIDFDNYTETTIYGKGTEGTKTDVVESDHISGIKGQGLYLHDRSHVILTGSGTECWTNLDNCTSGFSVSIWFQAKAHLDLISHILGTGVSYDKGFNFQVKTANNSELIIFKVFTSTKTYTVKFFPTALVNQWCLLVGIFNGNDDVQLYINGIESGGTSTTSGSSATDSAGFEAHLGVGFPHKGYPANAYFDQLKVYYKILNKIGKFEILCSWYSSVLHSDIVST